MTVASKLMTLEEYLNDDDGTDTCYELVDGELIAMPTESDLNDRIATFLFAYFLQRGTGFPGRSGNRIAPVCNPESDWGNSLNCRMLNGDRIVELKIPA